MAVELTFRPRLLEGDADCLHFGVLLQRLVPHLAAPARLLVAAEGQRRVEDVVAVDPDRPARSFARQRWALLMSRVQMPAASP